MKSDQNFSTEEVNEHLEVIYFYKNLIVDWLKDSMWWMTLKTLCFWEVFFWKYFCPNVIVIEWLDFELAYTDVSVRDISYYASGTTTISFPDPNITLSLCITFQCCGFEFRNMILTKKCSSVQNTDWIQTQNIIVSPVRNVWRIKVEIEIIIHMCHFFSIFAIICLSTYFECCQVSRDDMITRQHDNIRTRRMTSFPQLVGRFRVFFLFVFWNSSSQFSDPMCFSNSCRKQLSRKINHFHFFNEFSSNTLVSDKKWNKFLLCF